MRKFGCVAWQMVSLFNEQVKKKCLSYIYELMGYSRCYDNTPICTWTPGMGTGDIVTGIGAGFTILVMNDVTYLGGDTRFYQKTESHTSFYQKKIVTIGSTRFYMAIWGISIGY